MLSRDYDTFSHLFLFLQKRATAAKFVCFGATPGNFWRHSLSWVLWICHLKDLFLHRNFGCSFRIKVFCAIKKTEFSSDSSFSTCSVRIPGATPSWDGHWTPHEFYCAAKANQGSFLSAWKCLHVFFCAHIRTRRPRPCSFFAMAKMCQNLGLTPPLPWYKPKMAFIISRQ